MAFPINIKLTHQRVLVGLYVLLGCYLIARSIIGIEEIRSSFAAFFIGTPPIYGNLATAIVLLVPVSCFVIAYFIAKRTRSLLVCLPLFHTFLIFPIGVLLAIYPTWWFWKGNGANAT